jgi:hypothetical protein
MGALVLGASPARAEGTADDAAGIALFNEGKALRDAGDWEHAALKFAEAERLHPAAAILFNLAEAYEHLDRLASAWGAWKDAEIMARSARDASREQEAAARGAALAPKLAKLAIVVPPATRLPALEVRKDGAVVGEAQWGSALPADVGAHTIEASAPGHKAWSTVVRVDTNGSSSSVEVPALDVLATRTGETPAPFWSTQRIAGTTVGAAGVVGVVIGSVFGTITLSKASASKSHCAADLSTCDPTGGLLQQQAHTTADVSDAAFAIGGAAIIAGVVTFVTAPSGGAAPAASGARISIGPVAGAQMTGLIVQGGW